MTDMTTIGKWTIDLDSFDYKDFFVGEETVIVVIDGEEQEQKRYNYDHNSYYTAVSLKREKDQREHRGRLIEAFNQRGIARASVDFSGGNDEGGADGIVFMDADGNEVDVDRCYHYTRRNVDGKWVEVELTDTEQEQNKFISLVEAPIYWRWGSFAGDFSVSGTMQYNINDDKYCKMEYDESSYEHHREEF